MSKYAPVLTVVIIIAIAILGIYLVISSGNKSQTSLNQDQDAMPSISFNSDSQENQNNAIIKPSVKPLSQTEIENMTTLADGLKYEDVASGSGEMVKSGDNVTVHYLGTLLNGTKFDSSYDRGSPFSTQIGVDKL